MVIFDPVEILGARNPAVIGKLVAHEQDDEDRAGKPHRQARDIDEAVELVADEVAKRDDQIVVESWAHLIRSAGRGWDWRSPRAAWTNTVAQAITSATAPAPRK